MENDIIKYEKKFKNIIKFEHIVSSYIIMLNYAGHQVYIPNAGAINTATNSQINGSIYGPAYATMLVVVLKGGDNP